MRKLNWKAPMVYTTIGAIVGSTLMATPAAWAAQNFKTYWAKFVQDGQSEGSASAIQYGGTNYFGIYYLDKLLAKDGIQAVWNGSELQLNNVPVQNTTTLSVAGVNQAVAGSPLMTNAITVNGVTYVPLSTVQSLLSNVGVTMSGGDSQVSSGSPLGGTLSTPTISRGQVQSVTEKLKEAQSKLTSYMKNAPQLSFSGGLFGSQGGNGDAKDALHSLTSAMQKLQAAYTKLTALAATAGMTSTSTNGIGSGSTLTTTQATYGTPAGSTGSTGTLITPVPTDIASQLTTIASAIKSDMEAINQVALTQASSGFGFGGLGGLGSSSGLTTSGSTSPTTSPVDVSSIISDLGQQITQLDLLAAQLGSTSQDN